MCAWRNCSHFYFCSTHWHHSSYYYYLKTISNGVCCGYLAFLVRRIGRSRRVLLCCGVSFCIFMKPYRTEYWAVRSNTTISHSLYNLDWQCYSFVLPLVLWYDLYGLLWVVDFCMTQLAVSTFNAGGLLLLPKVSTQTLNYNIDVSY